MKKLNKVLALLLALVMVMSLAACGSKDNGDNGKDTSSNSSENSNDNPSSNSSENPNDNPSGNTELIEKSFSYTTDEGIAGTMTYSVPSDDWTCDEYGKLEIHNDLYEGENMIPFIDVGFADDVNTIYDWRSTDEDVEEGTDRTIGGINMKCYTYEEYYFPRTEYSAQLPNGAWVGITMGNYDDGCIDMMNAIVDSIQFE